MVKGGQSDGQPMNTNFLTAYHKTKHAINTWQSTLNLNCIWKTNILRPLLAKLVHFYLLTFDIFFINYEMV